MSAPTPNTRDMFVIHGRNEPARAALFTFLRSIGLKPIEWSQAIGMTGTASPYIGEVFDAAFSAAQAIVVLETPDDIAYLHPSLTPATPSATRSRSLDPMCCSKQAWLWAGTLAGQ